MITDEEFEDRAGRLMRGGHIEDELVKAWKELQQRELLEGELRGILAEHDAAPDGAKPWAATVSKIRALIETADEWYAKEVERMKEMAPA